MEPTIHVNDENAVIKRDYVAWNRNRYQLLLYIEREYIYEQEFLVCGIDIYEFDNGSCFRIGCYPCCYNEERILNGFDAHFLIEGFDNHRDICLEIVDELSDLIDDDFRLLSSLYLLN